MGGDLQSVVAGRLVGDAGAGVGLVHAALLDEPLDGHVDGHVDDDRRRQVVAGPLGEQRHVEHDDVVGVPLGVDPALDLLAERRVDDRVEVGERRRRR